jgi:hypothetical protein
MEKQTKWLLIAGLLCMASTYFLNLIHISEYIIDFIRGLGIGLIISTPFVQRKLAKKHASCAEV